MPMSAGYIYNGLGYQGWTVTYGVAAACAALMCVFAWRFAPDNPLWFVRHSGLLRAPTFADTATNETEPYVFNSNSSSGYQTQTSKTTTNISTSVSEAEIIRAKEVILSSLQFVQPSATMADVISLVQTVRQQDQTVENLRVAVERANFIREEEVQQNDSSWVDRAGHYLFTRCLTMELRIVFSDRTFARCLWLKLGYNFLKIITGQTVIIVFSSEFYAHLYPQHVELLTFTFLFLRCLVSVLMLFTADMLPRRAYMLLSPGLMTVGYSLAAIGFASGGNVLGLCGLILSGVGFQMGFGSIGYFLLNEIVPYYIRSTTNALSYCILFASQFVIVFFYPAVQGRIGYVWLLTVFVATSILAFYVILVYLPETRSVNIEVAYKLVDGMFDRAPQIQCCSGEEGGDKIKGSSSVGGGRRDGVESQSDAENVDERTRLL